MTGGRLLYSKSCRHLWPGRKDPYVLLHTEKAQNRFLHFFTPSIRKQNTGRAYYKAANYLRSDGLTEARRMAHHADPRTTQLYDRRSNSASLESTRRWGSEKCSR